MSTTITRDTLPRYISGALISAHVTNTALPATAIAWSKLEYLTGLRSHGMQRQMMLHSSTLTRPYDAVRARIGKPHSAEQFIDLQVEVCVTFAV